MWESAPCRPLRLLGIPTFILHIRYVSKLPFIVVTGAVDALPAVTPIAALAAVAWPSVLIAAIGESVGHGAPATAAHDT